MPRQALHKENLVRTAMRLFRRQGYAATGLQQIISESGAPRGSLYHYFPEGKESLAAAAVNLAGEQLAQMLRSSLDSTETLTDFITSVTGQYTGWMNEGQFSSGCPIATTMLECAPQSFSVTKAGAQAFSDWTSIAAIAFMRSGCDETQAALRAEALLAAIEGALILARVQRSSRPLDNIAALYAG